VTTTIRTDGELLCRTRRRLPWLLALPLMTAGSLAAHSLSYLFVSARAGEGVSEASERASTGSAGYLVLFLGILGATAVVAAAAHLRLAGGQRESAVSPGWFFVLPPLAFTVQELAERLLRAEAVPFQAALEPRFLLGLLLQLPFGLLALLLARMLRRVVRRLVRALARARTPRLRTALPCSLLDACDLPRIPALALGYPQRGSPGF
jgi:hypothetical protein